jgi:integrase
MSVYRRRPGGPWSYKFKFQGVVVRESTGLTSKGAARDAERMRHNELREARAGVGKRKRTPLFSMAAENWLTAKADEWAAKTLVIERTNIGHLLPVFGKELLSDIDVEDVARYRNTRLREGAEKKTVSNELGALRAILLYHDMDTKWRQIRRKVKLSRGRKLGRKLTDDEQAVLVRECRASRSRSLPVAVELALETGMRYSEIRLLQWRQVDFACAVVTVGKSKTEAGTGREIPLSQRAELVMTFWAANFPNRKLNHFVFPAEQYGGSGKDESFGFNGSCVYATDPNNPIGSWKEAWEAAKQRAGVECRFHDLRHTACSRLLDSGASHPVVAELMGWSASTAIRMIKEVYGHVGLAARRSAVQAMERASAKTCSEGTQKGAHFENAEKAAECKLLKINGSSGRTRTYNPPVNSRMLCH